MQEWRKWHLARGWRDVGYHYGVRRDGTIETGRPESRQGAGVARHNAHSIHVCFEGHGDHEHWLPKQTMAGLRLLQSLRQRYGLSQIAVLGHREAPSKPAKTCPGVRVDMDWVREEL
jgi:N-acetylmuramoyl-L-alanine amidase